MNPRLGFRPRSLAAAMLVLAAAAPVSAQVDPLLFLKTAPPNVVFVVDTAHRMQRSAPTNPATVATSQATSHYYDPFIYTKNATNPAWQTSIGVTDANTLTSYRRRYNNLEYAPLRGAGQVQRVDDSDRRRPDGAALLALRRANAAGGRSRGAVPGRRREQDGRAIQPGEDAADDPGRRHAGQFRTRGGCRRAISN